ncbi:bactofilin family protein [Breznakiella homolactica]|uniref:Polymer-forming cytoskeletal protein n=1 Tax=Breznakiella homolactica TaxID=2798577 RepID=A0A7T7XL50_9SPIR|nr:polymer-forming cytoskeletal protein [Breznakiella homolactica]QQO08386.1 polymer-forming cytoskeletal protein [Breznakiella homolactica]
MAKYSGSAKKGAAPIVVFGNTTQFSGRLKFKETLKIQGKFKGTIEATGALIIDKGALVEADHISVASLTVYGTVIGSVRAVDKIDMFPGAEVRGDIQAAHLRIADGVLFEGQCSMTGLDKDVEIFSRPTEEIKAELQRNNG